MNKLNAEKLSCSRGVMELKIGGYCLDTNGKPVGTIVSVDDENWYWKPLEGLNAYLIYTADVYKDYGCCAYLVYAESEENAKEWFTISEDYDMMSERRKATAFEPSDPSFKIMLVDKVRTESGVFRLCSYFE